MERDNSYRNVVKLEVDEKALSPSRSSSSSSSSRTASLAATFLALLALLLAILLAILAVLYFQKERKLQELEGGIEKIRTTLQLSNLPGKKSEHFRLSDAHLLENIYQAFSETQAHLEDVRASRAAAEERYRNFLGMVSRGWKFYNGSFYFFSQEAKPWQEAEAACTAHGAHLTSVTSQEEKGYLSGQTRGTAFWIGLTDEQQEGEWTWVDGARYSPDVSFWVPGQPDNWSGAPGHQENCVTFSVQWNDISCTHSYKWICKKLS